MSFPRVLLVRIGLRSAGVRKGAPSARLALLFSLAAVSLGGCSTTAPSPTGGLFGGLMAAISDEGSKPVRPVAEVEDDGLESQLPPRQRMYPPDDDPAQPFSPNYGSVPLPAADEAGKDPAAPA